MSKTKPSTASTPKKVLRAVLYDCATAVGDPTLPKALRASITARFIRICASDEGIFEDGTENGLIASLEDFTKSVNQIVGFVKAGVLQ